LRGSHFGKIFSISTFGESHGVALGAVVDGVPAGLTVDKEALQRELDKRSPGRSMVTSARREKDIAEILSGIFEGKTLGTPIAVIVRNGDARSEDYKDMPMRPGHADEATLLKYGFRDPRGGGRASGRETVGRVIGGYFAGLLLPAQTKVKGAVSQIGGEDFSKDPQWDRVSHESGYLLEPYRWGKVEALLAHYKADGNSLGCEVAVKVLSPQAGLGEPVFDKLKADFAKALLSIPGCTSFSYGMGEDAVQISGKELSTSQRENFGGIEGGISVGHDIFLRAPFKAPSTVGERAQLGRHDPCLAPRVVPVVEAMVKIVLADHVLRQRAYGDSK
jgi:chorismate synthase